MISTSHVKISHAIEGNLQSHKPNITKHHVYSNIKEVGTQSYQLELLKPTCKVASYQHSQEVLPQYIE